MFNALTIDVEDYFQVENFRKVIKFSDWDSFENRVVRNTQNILEILANAKTKATFFILGWVAERFPGLVKEIFQAGHEIASHGYAHQLLYTQTQKELRADLRKAKMILENIVREPILGYRAPSYSITKKSIWVLDLLMEENFKYDSSIFPIYHDKGGIPNAKRFIHKIKRNGKEIIEFPLSTTKILGCNIPFSGGGYFRLFPYWFIRNNIKKINNEGHSVIVYLHPWEIDANQPRIAIRGLSSFRHYINLDKTENKLKRLLKEFQFSSIQNFLNTNIIKMLN